MRNEAHDRAGRSALSEFFIGKGAASGCPFHRFNHRVVEDVKAVWGLGRQAFGRREPLPEPFQRADGAKADFPAMRVLELGALEAPLRLQSEEPPGAGFSIALLRAKMDDLNRQVFLPDAPACEIRPAEQPQPAPSRRDAEPAEVHSRNEQILAFQSQATPSRTENILQMPIASIQPDYPPPAMVAPYEPMIIVPAARTSPVIAGPVSGFELKTPGRPKPPYGSPAGIRGEPAAAATHLPEKPQTGLALSGAQHAFPRAPRQPAPPTPSMITAPVKKPAAAKKIKNAQKVAVVKEPRLQAAEPRKKEKRLPQPKAPGAERKPKKAPAAALAKYPQPSWKKPQERPEAGISRKPPAKEGGLAREKPEPPEIRHPEDAWLKGIKGKKKISGRLLELLQALAHPL